MNRKTLALVIAAGSAAFVFFRNKLHASPSVSRVTPSLSTNLPAPTNLLEDLKRQQVLEQAQSAAEKAARAVSSIQGYGL